MSLTSSKASFRMSIRSWVSISSLSTPTAPKFLSGRGVIERI